MKNNASHEKRLSAGICERCGTDNVSLGRVTAGGPAELWRGCDICQRCVLTVMQQTVEHIIWQRGNADAD